MKIHMRDNYQHCSRNDDLNTEWNISDT